MEKKTGISLGIVFLVLSISIFAVSAKACICGNGIKESGEQCEYPNTPNNVYCPQEPLEVCNGTLLGVRDAYGNCNNFCQCVKDPYVYSCVPGKCGAECSSDGDCDDWNEHTTDTCLEGCMCRHDQEPYCGDGILQLDMGENCDDGNNIDGDGCSAECEKEDDECVPRTIGYWKQPCKGHFNHETEASLLAYLVGVHGMTDIFDDVADFDDICDILEPDEPASMEDRARQQILALWFNVASGKIYLCTQIELGELSDAGTVEEALEEAESLLEGDESDKEDAKDIADTINNAENTGGIIIVCECPTCGDGTVEPPEECEPPGSFNNEGCPQEVQSECLGAKLGVRDAYGNCDSECGCTYDPFIYQCVKGECGAECEKNSDCSSYCVGKFRYFNGVCRTCYDCSCSFSYENCDARDGWYDGLEYRWVPISECTEKEQVKKEYRDYYCAPAACAYVPSEESWTDTGKTRDREGSCDDGQFCTVNDHCVEGECVGGEGRNCSDFDLPPVETCFYDPDSNPFTWDYGEEFTSVCDEAEDKCTTGEQDIGHECSIEECDAECEEDPDCGPSECCETFWDYCSGLKLVEYDSDKVLDSTQVTNSVPNTCLEDCACTDNPVECVPPPKNEYCVPGMCDAECDGDEDCDDGDPNTIDSCLEDCSCKNEYVPSCGNGIVDNPPETCELPGTENNEHCEQSEVECDGFKAAIRDQYGDCDAECGCVEDPLEFECVPGACGAECSSDGDCDDKDPDTIDTCMADCQCHHEVYVPFCGNGILDPPEEQCELNGTADNDYCVQTTTLDCAGFKLGVRDAYGNCDSECGCTYDPFIYQCVKGECGASCSTNSDCKSYCVGKFRYFNGVCRTCSTCSCSYSYENCDYRDGWYTTAEYQWVATGECTEKEQVKKEYRDYYCAPEACQYTVTKEVWEDTDNEGNKEDGTLCGLPRDCQEDRCMELNWIDFPEDGNDYCQGGECVVYSCEPLSSEPDPECGEGDDYDGDGIPDSEDACPEVYGLDCNGCPNPCTGCAVMVCESGPPECAADDSKCVPAECPADGCGLEGCSPTEMSDYPDSVPSTCGLEGNLGICGGSACTPTCMESELCMPKADHVVFSQVMYKPPSPQTENEWLELHNPTGSDVNLDGFKIYDDASDWFMPEGIVIKSGGYITIARDAAGFYSLFGCYPSVDGFTRPLTDSGKVLRLKYGTTEIDMVAYKNFIPGWDIWADENKVIARSPVWQDTDSPSDWLNNTEPELHDYEITAATDSYSYYPGTNMSLTGRLVNTHCTLPEDMRVIFDVIGCCMSGEMRTDSEGYFTGEIEIPPETPPGNYTIEVIYMPPAGDNVSNTTDFDVTVDMDGDGYDYSSDCNDTNPSVYPGAPEICGNGIDEDCSGADAACPSGPTVVTITSGGGGGGGGGGCSPNWSCTDFSECQPDGTQARTCTDTNMCNTTLGRPEESEDCTYTETELSLSKGCLPGERMCIGNDLMECTSESQWIKVQACESGCSGNVCLEKPVQAGMAGVSAFTGLFLLEPSAWPYWIAIAAVIIVLGWYLLGRRRKKKMKGSSRFRYQWKGS